jgi:hypothetical protein
MKEIELSQGRVTIVDDELYDYLNQWKWCYANGYAQRTDYPGKGTQKTIRMSRIIVNPPDGMEVDHINLDKLDNQRSNLRVCTRSQNCSNKKKTAKSGRKGVYWNKNNKNWVACMKYHGKGIHLGSFTNLDDAAEAYANGAKKYFGEFAYVERE